MSGPGLLAVVDAALAEHESTIRRLIRDRLALATRALVADELHLAAEHESPTGHSNGSNGATRNGSARSSSARVCATCHEREAARYRRHCASCRSRAARVRRAAATTVEDADRERVHGVVGPVEQAAPTERICVACGEQPPARHRTICERCRQRRRKAQRGLTATVSRTERVAATEAPSDPQSRENGSQRPPQPAPRRRGRTVGNHLRSADEREQAEQRRDVIAAAPTRVEQDDDGRSWTVRELPPTFVAPLTPA